MIIRLRKPKEGKTYRRIRVKPFRVQNHVGETIIEILPRFETKKEEPKYSKNYYRSVKIQGLGFGVEVELGKIYN